VENIHTHLGRGPLARAALDGTLETTLPRLLAMLCILAVFIPPSSWSARPRRCSCPGASVGFSMIASYRPLQHARAGALGVVLPKNTNCDEALGLLLPCMYAYGRRPRLRRRPLAARASSTSPSAA
jgi:hypothetical protein